MAVSNIYMKWSLSLVVIMAIGACSDTHQSTAFSSQVNQCLPSEGFNPVCTFKNPEDLVLLPDEQTLLVSEMGEFMTDAVGQLSMFDLTEQIKQPIEIVWENKLATWGEQNCSRPNSALFSPHGIDLVERKDGKLQVLVVNHGGRESVELFELLRHSSFTNETEDTHLNKLRWTLFWRGCAMPPGDPYLNDVAGLQNGGFLVTHMWDKSQAYATLVMKYILGIKTGWVWQWEPETGFQKMENSSGIAPNGIAINNSESVTYINMYGQNQLVVLSLDTHEQIAEVEVQQPDNVTVDEEGTVWIASHKHNPVTEDCKDVTLGSCLLPFEVIKLNPSTFETSPIIAHPGTSMGYATVALHVSGTLYMGSAHGDRLVRYSLNH